MEAWPLSELPEHGYLDLQVHVLHNIIKMTFIEQVARRNKVPVTNNAKCCKIL